LLSKRISLENIRLSRLCAKRESLTKTFNEVVNVLDDGLGFVNTTPNPQAILDMMLQEAVQPDKADSSMKKWTGCKRLTGVIYKEHKI